MARPVGVVVMMLPMPFSLGENLARVAAQGLQPLLIDRVAIDLQQQVRAALQVEAERHALVGQPARPVGRHVLRKEVRDGKDNTQQGDDER